MTAVRKKKRNIFRRTFGPTLAILLILLGGYTIFVQQNVLTYLKECAFAVLQEETSSRRDYVESQMTGQWTDVSRHAEHVNAIVEETLQQERADISDISTNAALNQQILKNVTGETIDVLKNSGATEVFLILDGVATEQSSESKAGIYIRNGEPSNYSKDTGNLLFERGIPDISKEWQIALDIYWKASFDLELGNDNHDYFYKPLEVAQEIPDAGSENLGFWNYGYPLEGENIGILSYSVPLISTDGTVYGVLGIGVDENYFTNYLHIEQDEENQTRGYLLAKTLDGISYETAVMEGKVYRQDAFTEEKIRLIKEENENIYYIEGDFASEICCSVQELEVYSPNMPYANETWVVLGIQQKDELLDNYFWAQQILVIILLVSLLICICCVFWITSFISRPIRDMMLDLRESDPNRPIHLDKVQIEEIDELAESIENLSGRVAKTYSKFAKILEMSDAQIAVFEYKEQENLIYCSERLYEMVGLHQWGTVNEYVDGTHFKSQMHWLLPEEIQQQEVLLELPGESKSKRWVKLSQHRENGSVLGVVMDVTEDILEKQKIEYERDYDILTNLLNRRAMEEQMSRIFEKPDELQQAVMLVWDLDNLKYVNDAYGHSVGDEYIYAFAKELKQMCSEQIISSRRSGDEFVTFIYGYEQKEELQKQIDIIWERVHRAQIDLVDGRKYPVQVSMGKAWYPTDAEDVQTLFRYADFAMYMAKNSRKGTMADFEQESYQENRILLQGQEAFNILLEKHLVKYMLQPIVSAVDGSIFGYEMLMRSASEAFRSPLDILRMAHAQARLYEIEIMTWFEAMRSYAEQVNKGACDATSKIFVNSISNQLMNDDMVRLFEMVYEQYLPNIVCEITEGEQSDNHITQKKLEMIRRWNAMTAIDDYGCGYNNESILLETSPDIVKIDMGIVRGIHKDENRKRLVSNLVLYAKERNIKVLGEGVEEREEMQTLISLGVDLLQGYYIGRPDYEAQEVSEELRKEIKKMHQN